jgi:uncharacterized membrane protein YfcA
MLSAIGAYVGIGIFAGFLAGMLGLGGGVVVVPGLLFIFDITGTVPQELAMQVATGTSLTAMLFTSMRALGAHSQSGTLMMPIFNQLWPGLIMGSLLGIAASTFLSTDWLKVFFGVFLVFVSYKMYKGMAMQKEVATVAVKINKFISLGVGIVSGLLGVGGGTMVIPYLDHLGVPMRQTAAISGFCTLTVAFTGSIGAALMGLGAQNLPPYTLGYVYWPAVLAVAIPGLFFAPLGARVMHALPTQHLRYAFITIALLMAVNLLI